MLLAEGVLDLVHDRVELSGRVLAEVYAQRIEHVAEQARDGVVRQACAKRFYVSPFLPLEGRYVFLIRPPGERVSIVIRHSGPQGLRLVASLTGRRSALTDRALLGVFARFPLMTLKVIASIHWQALRLWLKGAKFHPHRPHAAPVAAAEQAH